MWGSSVGCHFIDIYIYPYVNRYICTVTRDFQTGNVFVLIVQCRGPAQRCSYLSLKCPRTTRQTDRHKIIKGLRTTGWLDGPIILPLRIFEPVASECMRCTQLRAAQMNFYFQSRTVYKQKFPYDLYLKKARLFFGCLYKKSFKRIITLVNLKSRGRMHDHQKATQMKQQTDRQRYT